VFNITSRNTLKLLLNVCRFLVLIFVLIYKHWRNYNWI